MSKLFPTLNIDLKNGTAYSIKYKRYIGCLCEDGYIKTKVFDKYGNQYVGLHEIIIAEGLQLPKHLWPVDENGKRYIVDHIIPVKNGGTNTIENLHLIPKSDNAKNPMSKKNYSEAKIGNHLSEKAKKKLSELHKGKKQTKEHIENRAEARKKPILQKLKNGTIIEWKSASDCELITNGFYKQNCISSACNGTYSRKTNFHFYKGSEWFFKEQVLTTDEVLVD